MTPSQALETCKAVQPRIVALCSDLSDNEFTGVAASGRDPSQAALRHCSSNFPALCSQARYKEQLTGQKIVTLRATGPLQMAGLPRCMPGWRPVNSM